MLKGIYYEKLAHESIEAEKSHSLSSPRMGPMKAVVYFKSMSKGLRARGANDVNPSLRAGEDDMKCPTQALGQEKGQIPPFSTFCSTQAFNQFGEAHPHWG